MFTSRAFPSEIWEILIENPHFAKKHGSFQAENTGKKWVSLPQQLMIWAEITTYYNHIKNN